LPVEGEQISVITKTANAAVLDVITQQKAPVRAFPVVCVIWDI